MAMDKRCSNCDYHVDRNYDNGMVFCKKHWCTVWGGSVGCMWWAEIVEVW